MLRRCFSSLFFVHPTKHTQQKGGSSHEELKAGLDKALSRSLNLSNVSGRSKQDEKSNQMVCDTDCKDKNSGWDAEVQIWGPILRKIQFISVFCLQFLYFGLFSGDL